MKSEESDVGYFKVNVMFKQITPIMNKSTMTTELLHKCEPNQSQLL